MAKIYISSTSSDLEEHRKRAYSQMRRHGHDVLSMEDYNPGTRRPVEKCREDVRETEIYIVLIGWQYGSIPEDDNPNGHSYTENEYDEALEHGKEIIALLVDEDKPWPPPLMDSHTGANDAGAKVRAFRERVSKNHMRGTFETPDQLAAALSPAVEEACANLTPVEKLDDVAVLSRDDLQNLAARFGIEDCFTLPDTALRQQLTQKADDYRQIVKEVENLKGLSARIDNVHAAAIDAIRLGKFDEARELIDDAIEIHQQEVLRPALETNAKLLEASAEIELLRGRVDQAYAIFIAAAESFRELDILEMAKRRDRYQGQLFEHGLRYGGTALSRAIDIQRPGIEALKDTDHREIWAALTQNLAIALRNQGTRTEGEAGTALLAEAVTAYRDALTVFTREDHPPNWAMTTQNLALALQNQGTRTKGEAGTALLAEAVTAYRDALTVRTREDHPVGWATTTQNLAIALRNQGIRTEGAAGTALLAEAVTAYRDALTVRTREDHPVEWAMTTQNLAVALQEQGIRTDGEAGTALLAEAVTAYRDALNVFTRQDHPVDWAMNQENLAIAELRFAYHPATKDPAPHLKAALDYVEAALTVYDPEHMSYDYGTATRLRDDIQARLDAL